MHSYSPNHAPSLDRLQCRLQPPARSFSRPLPPRSQGHCRVACGLGNTLPSIRMGVSCFSCTLASSPSRGYWSSALAIHGCGLADAITSCVFLLQRCKLHHVWKHVYQKNVRVDCNAYGDVDVFRIGRHRCTRIHQIMLPRLIVCSVGFSHLLDLHLSLMAGLFFSRLKASPWYEWVPSHQNPSDPLSRDGWQDATAISNIRSGVYAPLHIEPPWHLLSPTLESLSEVITALE